MKEPEIAKHMASALAGEKKVYSYCASCSGNLTRGGCQNVRHLRTEILKTYEKPDVKKSMINRAKTKFTYFVTVQSQAKFQKTGIKCVAFWKLALNSSICFKNDSVPGDNSTKEWG